jgi:hypothetical protein
MQQKCLKLKNLPKTGYNATVASNHLSICPQDALQMHRKTGSRKPLELIANAIASVGFINEKATGKLPVLAQGMDLPEFCGKISDFENARLPGRRACTKFSTKRRQGQRKSCRGESGELWRKSAKNA